MSPNPSRSEDPTPLATNMGEELNLSSLARLLGRIEQKCDSAIEGLKTQADQIRGLRVAYDDIRAGVVDASRMRDDLNAMKAWRDAREESGRNAAVERLTRAKVAEEQEAASEKSILGRARNKFMDGASQISGTLIAGAVLGWLAHLLIEYIKGK